jgi:hypothetical protein
MMPALFRLVFPYLVFASLLAILVWAFQRWWRTPARIGVPAWQSYVAIGAFGLAALSFLLWLILFAWAHAIGGFPFYHPVVMRFYAWGFLTGACGIAMSLAGKGKLRWPACGVSALMTFLWIAAATGE